MIRHKTFKMDQIEDKYPCAFSFVVLPPAATSGPTVWTAPIGGSDQAFDAADPWNHRV